MSNFANGGHGKCKWEAGGRRCGNTEVDGLEYCVLHVPDDLLEEAEEITGAYRCRHDFGTPDPCRQYAVAGTRPPHCEKHGANIGSMQRERGRQNLIEERLAIRLAEIMEGEGQLIVSPDPIGDPLTELLATAAEVRAVKEVLRLISAQLFSQQRLRYAHSKVGEQLRTEILLYERALDRYTKLLIDIAKLRIEERLAGVQESTAVMLEKALDAALEESGVGLDGKSGARKAFRRHLKVVQGELVS